MSERVALYGGIVLILLAFALVMGAGDILGPSKGAVAESLEDINQAILDDNWEGALAGYKALQKEWSESYTAIDFQEDRLPLFQFETDLARLHGSIIARDNSSALQLILEMRSIWQGF